MSNTTTNRNLLVIIGMLLLTNIAVLVYFLWVQKPTKPPVVNKDKNGLADMLKKDVGFNDEQVEQYKKLKDAQWNTIRPMFDDMRKVKDSLFRLLSSPTVDDSIVNKATDAIAKKQKALDLQTFNHFKKVRTLCTTDQQPRYDSMILRMFRKMGKQPKRPATDSK